MIAAWGSEAQSLIAAALSPRWCWWRCRSCCRRPHPRSPKPRRPCPKDTAFPKDFHVWLLGFLTLASMVPEGAVLDWAAIYLQKELVRQRCLRPGLGFAFFAGAMAIMRFAGDTVRNRLGAVRTLRLSGFLGPAGLMGGALSRRMTGWRLPALRRRGSAWRTWCRSCFRPPETTPPACGHRDLDCRPWSAIAAFWSRLRPSGFLAEHAWDSARPMPRLALILVVVALLAARAADADARKVLVPAAAQAA
jgi:hypothetical protein